MLSSLRDYPTVQFQNSHFALTDIALEHVAFVLAVRVASMHDPFHAVFDVLDVAVAEDGKETRLMGGAIVRRPS